MDDKLSIQNPKPKIQNPDDLRILLWDIDGTILQSGHAGGFKDYFSVALENVYGSRGKIFEVSASGATDMQIIFKSLESDGFTIETISSKLGEFMAALENEMKAYIDQRENVYELLPGISPILDDVSTNPRFLNSLLTGNFACGAELKLGYVDVWRYFQSLPHAYGDISHDRRELGKAARDKINRFLGVELHPAQFIVIGDTPNDIAAARAFGAKVISVGTGRGVDPKELFDQKPDAYFENLSDSAAFLSVLENF